MTEEHERRFLFMTVLFSMLFVSFAYVALMPRVNATEPTVPEKSLLILNSVAGFNMTAYTPSLRTYEQNSFLSVSQEEADFTLSSSQGSLRTRCSFVDNHLRQIFISEVSGSPMLNQPVTDAVGMAEGFLERYRSYTGISFYGELKSMLGSVGVGENMTKTVGNVRLEVSVVN
jgi:hypothetical protein